MHTAGTYGTYGTYGVAPYKLVDTSHWCGCPKRCQVRANCWLHAVASKVCTLGVHLLCTPLVLLLSCVATKSLIITCRRSPLNLRLS